MIDRILLGLIMAGVVLGFALVYLQIAGVSEVVDALEAAR